MNREDRYIVLKISDIEAADGAGKIPNHLWESFQEFCDKVSSHRLDFKPEREYVVVQDNWPEYESVWEMIEARTK